MDHPITPGIVATSPSTGGAAGQPAPGGGATAAFKFLRPTRQSIPIVLASPHSGRDYPASFLAQSRLDPHLLRRSEDCYVDEIFAGVVDLGAPLLAALFPRSFVDPNREPHELDPTMFDGPVPPHINSRSPRVAAGLGTIPRVVATGEEIYRRRLSFAEATERLDQCYAPYHEALRQAVEDTRQRFGYCLLLDCHSMPSIGLPPEVADKARVDVILGDCFGTACSPRVTEAAEAALRRLGYSLRRNTPYAGGFTTKHYGRPEAGVHALQIEINRSLYMDETSLARRPYLTTLSGHMERLVGALAALPPDTLTPRR